MGKIKCILIAIIISFTASSQKAIDLKLLNVYSDSTNLISDTIKNPYPDLRVPIQYFIEFTNVGTNTITHSDTVLFHYYINGVKQTFDNHEVFPLIDSIPYFGLELQQNDTILLRTIIFSSYGNYTDEYNDNFEECFELIPSSINATLNEITPIDNILCYNRTVFYDGLSINQESESLNLQIYPNPSSDYIYFSHPVENIQFYNISGQEIRRFTQVNPLKTDIQGIEKGMYFIKFEWKGKNLVKNIIIQ